MKNALLLAVGLLLLTPALAPAAAAPRCAVGALGTTVVAPGDLLDPVKKTAYYDYLVQVLGFEPCIALNGVTHSESVEALWLFLYTETGEDIDLPNL